MILKNIFCHFYSFCIYNHATLWPIRKWTPQTDIFLVSQLKMHIAAFPIQIATQRGLSRCHPPLLVFDSYDYLADALITLQVSVRVLNFGPPVFAIDNNSQPVMARLREVRLDHVLFQSVAQGDLIVERA